MLFFTLYMDITYAICQNNKTVLFIRYIPFSVFVYIISYVDHLLIYVIVNVHVWLLLALMLCGTSVWNVM